LSTQPIFTLYVPNEARGQTQHQILELGKKQADRSLAGKTPYRAFIINDCSACFHIYFCKN